MMKAFQIFGVALALAIPSSSFAQDTAKPTESRSGVEQVTGSDYVAMAASSDMFEIQSSQLALQTSKSESIQAYANHMVSDHSMTTNQIMAAAQAKNIAVPTTMMPKHADMLQKLQGLSGDEFDAQYVQLQVVSHEEAVALHTSYSQNGDDAALKAVATEAVPIVTEHLNEAQALASKV